jgi:TonB family protein
VTLNSPADHPASAEAGQGLRVALAISAVLHLLLFFLLPELKFESRLRYSPDLNIEVKPRQITRLVAPPDIRDALTQKEPNKTKVSKELDLEGLLAKATAPNMPEIARPAPAPQPRQFQAPGADASKSRSAAPPPTLLQAPELNLAQNKATELPAMGNTLQGINAVPPPPASEKPKMAFESIGAASTGAGAKPGGLIPVPKNSVDEAVRAVARGQGSSGLVVGDVGDIGGSGGFPSPAAPAQLRNGSTLQLLSDPMGVDFRPYLIQVLAAVKRNWQAVMPESARLGRQGKVSIQFAINRTGQVPKLVIASASGTDAFDRAAVASISMTNPFPPLPPEFRGDQIRLQFAFLYNVPRN